jgi:hypothetical protein
VYSVAGISVSTVTVTSPTSLIVSLTGSAATTPQPVSIWVTTGKSSPQEAVLPNGLTIQ